jgi:chromate reductase, NAD(P)H dehydrogenase (quinone)
MRVLGISGSLREGSHNTKLLRAAAAELPPEASFVLFEGLAAVPPYVEDHDGDAAPPGAVALRAAIDAADAVVIATPEYNSSVPGQLKNALDWASRPLATNPLRRKPVVVGGASTGVFGAVWAQAELRKTLAATGARVLDAELPVGRAATRFEGGRLVDEDVRGELRRIVEQLAHEARVTRQLRTSASVAAAAA